MKRIKFKSLTFRIWTTFTLFSIIIILTISILYMGIFKVMNKNSKMEALMIAHQMMLEREQFKEKNTDKFNRTQSIGRIEHMFLKKLSEDKIDIFLFRPHEGQYPPEVYQMANWFASFIKEEKLDKQKQEATYQGKKILFIISTAESKDEGQQYLVSYSVYDDRNSGFLGTVLVIGSLFIVIALMVSKIISNYISRPLKKLEEQAFKIANKEQLEPMRITSEDEIGSLIKSINEMQLALQQADKEEKRFLQSISHDLKTPIMVIMGHAQAILDGMYVESIENTAEIIKVEATRLENKVKQILYYNTLDYLLESKLDKTEEVSFEFKKLLKYICGCFKTINPDICWELDLHHAMVKAKSDKVQVAVENILDNQLRYAKTMIKLQLRQEGEFAVLHIYNDGENIESTLISCLFDEFYKGNTGNFGLGLTISKRIIEFYGGSIEAKNEAVGVCFILKLQLT